MTASSPREAEIRTPPLSLTERVTEAGRLPDLPPLSFCPRSSSPARQLTFLRQGLLSNIYLPVGDRPMPLLRWLLQVRTAAAARWRERAGPTPGEGPLSGVGGGPGGGWAPGPPSSSCPWGLLDWSSLRLEEGGRLAMMESGRCRPWPVASRRDPPERVPCGVLPLCDSHSPGALIVCRLFRSQVWALVPQAAALPV